MSAATSGEKSPRFPKSVTRTIRILVLLLALQLFLVPQIAVARDDLKQITDVNLVLVGLAVVAVALSLFAYAQVLRVILPQGQRPSHRRLYGIVLASFGFSHVIPAGSAAGNLVSYRLLRESGVRGSTAGYALGVTAIGSAVVLNLIFLVALVVSIPRSGFQPIYATGAGITIVLLLLVGAIVSALTRGVDRAKRVVRWAAAKVRVDPDSAEDAVHNIGERLSDFLSDRPRAAKAAFWATANWLLDAAALGLVITAFGTGPRIEGLIIAFCLANVLAAIPVTPGGLGIVEGVLIPTLVAFEITAAVSSLSVLTYRLIQFWLPIPVGGIAYLLLKRGSQAVNDDEDDEAPESLSAEAEPPHAGQDAGGGEHR